jgi:hypothetical protein
MYIITNAEKCLAVRTFESTMLIVTYKVQMKKKTPLERENLF